MRVTTYYVDAATWTNTRLGSACVWLARACADEAFCISYYFLYQRARTDAWEALALGLHDRENRLKTKTGIYRDRACKVMFF